jgi:GTPase SAR1 family protein
MTTTIVLVGAFASGKSSLLEAIVTGRTNYPTVTIMANIRKFKNLLFYDISGGNQFQLMIQSLIEKATIIIYCVDLSSPMALFYYHTTPFNVPVILVFTKSDLPCLYLEVEVQNFINRLDPVDVITVSVANQPFQAGVKVFQAINRILPLSLPLSNKKKQNWKSWLCCWDQTNLSTSFI